MSGNQQKSKEDLVEYLILCLISILLYIKPFYPFSPDNSLTILITLVISLILWHTLKNRRFMLPIILSLVLLLIIDNFNSFFITSLLINFIEMRFPVAPNTPLSTFPFNLIGFPLRLILYINTSDWLRYFLGMSLLIAFWTLVVRTLQKLLTLRIRIKIGKSK